MKFKEKPSGGSGRKDEHTNKNRQTDVTQPIVAFRYFANASKKKSKHHIKVYVKLSDYFVERR
jgi:hypothetical protein